MWPTTTAGTAPSPCECVSLDATAKRRSPRRHLCDSRFCGGSASTQRKVNAPLPPIPRVNLAFAHLGLPQQPKPRIFSHSLPPYRVGMPPLCPYASVPSRQHNAHRPTRFFPFKKAARQVGVDKRCGGNYFRTYMRRVTSAVMAAKPTPMSAITGARTHTCWSSTGAMMWEE